MLCAIYVGGRSSAMRSRWRDLALWASLWLMPRAIREWSVYGPLIASVVLQNIRVVTSHLDLPSGKYHDTWQLVLPRWLSIWLLHYDHHLEHHLRPRLHWHELPGLRASWLPKEELNCGA